MIASAQEVVSPWNLIDTEFGEHIYIVDHEDAQVVRFHKRQSEVAKRVVACVNACRGISTEDLLTSDFGEDSIEVGALLGQAMQQRDELLAELQSIAHANPREWDSVVRDQFQQWAQNRARAAIAKVSHANATDSYGQSRFLTYQEADGSLTQVGPM